MAIGLLLIGERLLPAGLPALVPTEPGWQLVAGILFGLCIGVCGGRLISLPIAG